VAGEAPLELVEALHELDYPLGLGLVVEGVVRFGLVVGVKEGWDELNRFGEGEPGGWCLDEVVVALGLVLEVARVPFRLALFDWQASPRFSKLVKVGYTRPPGGYLRGNNSQQNRIGFRM
jgi:hypothetical protein